jgi:hypothetical protein
MIAFYYGLTGFACVVYFRRALFKSVRNFFLAGVAPLTGGLMLAGIFVKSCIDLSKPANSESGENPVTGAILGSVVLRLVQRSPLPILVVPTEHSE